MFKDKKHIIFDLDGTLIDSIGMWTKLDEIMLTDMGIYPENIHKEREDFIHNNPSGKDLYLRYNQYLIDKYNLVGYLPKDLEKLRRKIGWHYQECVIDLKKGASDFLKKARRKGYTLTLATITSKEQIYIYSVKNENIKRNINFYEIFNGGIITLESVTKSKPDPEVYLKALQNSGISKEESIVVEDSLNGVKASKAAGIETIAMYDKYADADREKINSLVDYEIKNYAELIKKI